MSKLIRYRQAVSAFRERLNDLIQGGGPKQGRILIDTQGSRTIAGPSKSLEERLKNYGEGRLNSVARVLALFAITRETEKLDQRGKRVEVDSDEALWQAFRGTETENACHTCPTLLLLDGHPPTLITSNRGLQRHLIIEFADCVLMPRSINEIDIAVDDAVGREAFVDAAELVLNEKGMTWVQGFEFFQFEMEPILGIARDVLRTPLMGHSTHNFRPANNQDQERLDALFAYFEGLTFGSVNSVHMHNFIVQVTSEMGIH